MVFPAQSCVVVSENDAAEDLIYHVTHDLRAPLRALKTLPDWIEEDLASETTQVPESVAQHLRALRKQADLLDHMLLGLRDFSRVGRLSNAPTIVELEMLIRRVASGLAGKAGLKLTLELHVTRLRAPENDLFLLFDALLSNAVQHHDKTEVNVIVRSEFIDDGFVIAISDDGPGIDPDLRAQAFNLMTTLYGRDDGAGSGIGLALARRIITNMGGQITLEDNPNGRGLEVRIVLPLNTAISLERSSKPPNQP